MNADIRSKIDSAARDAAIASWDAHGVFVSADDAYAFVKELVAEEVRLPETRPAQFGHDYRRYCGAIEQGNPFITCDLSRRR